MEKAKKYAYMLLAAACVAVPVLFFLLGGLAHAVPQDLAHYDRVAFTPPAGEETVYTSTSPSFQGAVTAFLHAAPCDGLPTGYEERPFMTVSWIRSGRSRAYRLYLSPAAGEGYFADSRGKTFRLAKDDVIFFLRERTALPLLEGNLPPALLLGEREVPVSICRWTYTVTGGSGRPVEISSGEYVDPGAESVPARAEDFAPVFVEMPTNKKYTLYSGADAAIESETVPNLSALPAGEYQLVLVAEWQRASVCTRAGYSFALQIG